MADWSLVVPRRDVARGSPERVFAPPHRGLAGRALTYVGHDLPDTGRVPWRTVPLGAVVLTVDLGPPSPVRFADSAVELPPSPVLGLRDRPLVLEQRGALRGVVVALTPSGAHDLFGGAVGGLANAAVGLEDLLGAEGRVLAERLTEADGWAARFALLDGFLAGRTPPRRTPDAEVREAWRRLWATPDVRVVSWPASWAGAGSGCTPGSARRSGSGRRRWRAPRGCTGPCACWTGRDAPWPTSPSAAGTPTSPTCTATSAPWRG